MRAGIDCKGRKWEEIPRKNAKDMTNQVYEKLTGVCRVTGDFVRDTSAWWLFKCSCGNNYIARAAEVRYGRIHSCGCFKKEYLHETKGAHLEGQKFGRLLVLEIYGF